LELYIDASPYVKKDRSEVTKCTLCIRTPDLEVIVREAPPARNELEAKYFALEAGLKAVESRGIPPEGLTVYTDCWMLVNQLQGKYEVKDAGFLRHKRLVEDLGTRLGGLNIRYVPKQENLAHRALEERKR
jgi:ribonuclease HI